MKKLSVLFAMALMLFASCSKNEVIPDMTADEAVVTFTASLNGELGTKAISDGTSADQLKFMVYDASGNKIDALTQTVSIANKKATVTTTLAKGQTYSFAFWAQNSECGAYNTDNLNAVTVDYAKVTNNYEKMDAFCARVNGYEVKGSFSQSVTLKRPFAQINLATRAADWDAAVAAGFTVKNSTVKIEGVLGNTINVLAGTVTSTQNNSSTPLSLAPAVIPAEKLSVDFDADGTKEEYVYLSMNYLLPEAADAQKILAKAEFTLTSEDSKSYTLSVPNLPVQANYRTNIVGNILSGSGVFDIIIDEEYDDETNYEEFKLALMNGGTVVLNDDLTVNETFVVEGKDVVIDLNGKTLKYTGDDRLFKVYDAKLVIYGEGGNLEVNSNNLDISGTAAYIGTAYAGGEIVINGGKHTTNGCTLYHANGGKITINAGEFDAAETGYSQQGKYEYKYTLNVQGAVVGEPILVFGGTFKNYNPAESKGENPVANFVADGYKSVQNGTNIWTVVPESMAVAGTATELSAALSTGGEVFLTADVNLSNIVLTSGAEDVVIDAGGHTVTTTECYGIQVSGAKDVTVKNGNIVMTKEGNYITYAAGFKVENGDYEGATITLKDCSITMANGDWAYALNMPAGVKNLNLVVENCELEGAIAIQCWGDNNNIFVKNSVLKCNYVTTAAYTSYCVAFQGEGSNVAEGNTLVIDGCSFVFTGTDAIGSGVYAFGDNGSNNEVTITNCSYGQGVNRN